MQLKETAGVRYSEKDGVGTVVLPKLGIAFLGNGK